MRVWIVYHEYSETDECEFYVWHKEFCKAFKTEILARTFVEKQVWTEESNYTYDGVDVLEGLDG